MTFDDGVVGFGPPLHAMSLVVTGLTMLVESCGTDSALSSNQNIAGSSVSGQARATAFDTSLESSSSVGKWDRPENNTHHR